MRNNVKYHINMIVALISAVAGILIWKGCRYIYTSYHDILLGPVMIGILFSVLFFVMFLTVCIGSLISGSFNKESAIYKGVGNMAVRFLYGLIGVLFLSMVLEALYEVNLHIKIVKPSSYIFVIDESGSMSGNDSTGLRYKAIREIMEAENAGFPFMVYAFSDDTRILRNMGPLDADYEDIPVTCYGGTAIRGTILRILQDYKNGVWDGGANPKIIFLTDGVATDLSNGFLWFKGNMPEFNAALEEYHDLGINISTVGLGSVDREIMTKIAGTTRGVFVNIQDASELASAMKTAAVSYSERDLLSIRYMKRLDILYGMLRILFLSIIGTVIGSLIIFAYVEESSIPLIVASSFVFSLLGSILFEIGLKVGIMQNFLREILWLMFALTIGYVYPKAKLQLGDNELLIHSDQYYHIE